MPDWGSMPNLVGLNILNVKINGSWPPTLYLCTKIQSISFSGVGLTGIIPSNFYFPSLTRLCVCLLLFRAKC
jgi:hypothetical protein